MRDLRHSNHGLGRGLFGVLVLGALALMVHQIGADPGRGRLFASDPNENDLLAVRIASGRGIFLRDLGFPAGSLAVDVRDATTDALYLGQGVGASRLFVLDASTDSVRLVGNTGLGGTLHGLDFTRRDATTDAFSFPATLPDGKPAPGRLLAAVNLSGGNASGADHLAELDWANGEGILLGSFGVDGVESLAFDRDGTLWASVTSAGGAKPGLYTVELDSGLATFFTDFENIGTNGPPGAPSGGLTALQFACDGTLYGATGTAVSGPEPPAIPGSIPSDGKPPAPGGGMDSAKNGPLNGGPVPGGPTPGGPWAGSGGAPTGGAGGGLDGGGLDGGGLDGGGLDGGDQGSSEAPDQGAWVVDDGGRLVTIDPVTGYFTYAGLSAAPGGELGGFAFARACPTLFAPVPGVAGTENQLTAIGASPGGRLRLFASRSTGATAVAVPGCGVLTLELDGAKTRATATADAAGQATFEVSIPGGFSGETIYFQAIDRASCEVTNLGAHRFR